MNTIHLSTASLLHHRGRVRSCCDDQHNNHKGKPALSQCIEHFNFLRVVVIRIWAYTCSPHSILVCMSTQTRINSATKLFCFRKHQTRPVNDITYGGAVSVSHAVSQSVRSGRFVRTFAFRAIVHRLSNRSPCVVT